MSKCQNKIKCQLGIFTSYWWRVLYYLGRVLSLLFLPRLSWKPLLYMESRVNNGFSSVQFCYLHITLTQQKPPQTATKLFAVICNEHCTGPFQTVYLLRFRLSQSLFHSSIVENSAGSPALDIAGSWSLPPCLETELRNLHKRRSSSTTWLIGIQLRKPFSQIFLWALKSLFTSCWLSAISSLTNRSNSWVSLHVSLCETRQYNNSFFKTSRTFPFNFLIDFQFNIVAAGHSKLFKNHVTPFLPLSRSSLWCLYSHLVCQSWRLSEAKWSVETSYGKHLHF